MTTNLSRVCVCVYIDAQFRADLFMIIGKLKARINLAAADKNLWGRCCW